MQLQYGHPGLPLHVCAGVNLVLDMQQESRFAKKGYLQVSCYTQAILSEATADHNATYRNNGMFCMKLNIDLTVCSQIFGRISKGQAQ